MSRLEVAEEVLGALPEEAVHEAAEALEGGRARCEMCKRLLGAEEDERAALIALVSASNRSAVLTHVSCMPSRVMYVEGERTASPHPDAFNLDWHAVVRRKSPGAVFMWEGLTQIAGPEGDVQLDILRKLGFRTAAAPIEELSAPRAQVRSFHRNNAFCFSLNPGRVLQAHEPFAPGTWTARAGAERRVLAVYGINLRLRDFDPDHVNARIEEGDVLAATLPFDRNVS